MTEYKKVTVESVERDRRRNEIITLIVSVGLLIGLLYLIHSGATQNFDDGVMQWNYNVRQDGLNTLLTVLTYLGNWQAIVIVCLLFLMYRDNMYLFGIPLSIAAILQITINKALKLIMMRPRPDSAMWVINEGGYSCPSGHASVSIAVYFLLVLLLMRYMAPCATRKLFCITVTILSFVIGFTRVYLGVHYITDVIAGQLEGLAIAMIVLLFWAWFVEKKNIEVAKPLPPEYNVDFNKVHSNHLKKHDDPKMKKGSRLRKQDAPKAPKESKFRKLK